MEEAMKRVIAWMRRMIRGGKPEILPPLPAYTGKSGDTISDLDALVKRSLKDGIEKYKSSLWESVKKVLVDWTCTTKSYDEAKIKFWKSVWTGAYLIIGTPLTMCAVGLSMWGAITVDPAMWILFIVSFVILIGMPGLFLFRVGEHYIGQWREYIKQLRKMRARLKQGTAEEKSEAIVLRYRNTLERYKREVVESSRSFGMVCARAGELLARARTEARYFQGRLDACDAGDPLHEFASREQYERDWNKAQELVDRIEPVHVRLSAIQSGLTAHFDRELAKIVPFRSALSDHFHREELRLLTQEVGEVEELAHSAGLTLVQGFHTEVRMLQEEARRLSALSDKAIARDGLDISALEELAETLLIVEQKDERSIRQIETSAGL